jgi:transposase
MNFLGIAASTDGDLDPRTRSSRQPVRPAMRVVRCWATEAQRKPPARPARPWAATSAHPGDERSATPPPRRGDEALDQQIHDATATLAALLPKTPAGVLLGIPGVGVLTASSYGAAIGDPNRYRDAAAAYRASGLVPISYESAGRSRTRTGISREGSVELRRA